MDRRDKKKVSFPVTIWYVPDSGQIQIMRPTERGFQASVSEDPDTPEGHPQLYHALRRVLRDCGSGFAEAPTKYN